MRECLFLLLCVLPCCHSFAEVNVAAAISMKESLTRIGGEFTRQTGEKVNLAFGSSGQLTTQIEAGAEIDLFISAANAQVDDLIKNETADATTRTVVARNELVLIVPAGAVSKVTDLNDLPNARRIAIGEPKTVPAGQYAKQTLASLKIIDAVQEKLIYGSNVRQVLDLVIRNEVDAGIVYLTDANQAGDTVKIIATANPTMHEPLEYPAVIIKNAAHVAEAKKFLTFLQSDAAQEVFVAVGFKKP